MTGAPHAERRLVDRHFAGRASPADERAMRDHLAGCAACRHHYDRHVRLALVDPAALPYRERMRRGLGLPAPARRQVRAALWVPALALGALVLVLGGRLVRRPEIGARGAAPSSQLLAYTIAGDGSSRPLGPTLAADDRLAFAYANPGHKRRLYVFAVDGRGDVRWYHPAWTDAREDPIGIAIADDDRIHEIPEAVRQPLAEGPLSLVGVFADDARTVKEVERLVAAARATAAASPPALSWPGAEIVRLDARVERRR
jgi:hypothetical protein